LIALKSAIIGIKPIIAVSVIALLSAIKSQKKCY
jgi:hypothetical protein